MIRLSQLTGQRVLARQSGQQVGSIRRLLVDAQAGAVVSAELEGGVTEGTMIDWSAISSIGPDAVMIDSEDAVRGAQSEVEQRLSAGDLDLTDKLVLDEAGDALGPLEDLAFDPASGRLAGIAVPGHELPVDRLVAIGPDAIIIPRPEGALS